MAGQKGTGIHVQSAMAWLFGLLILGKPLTRPPIPESSDPTDFNGGSPNMKGLFSLCWYVWESIAKVNGVGRERLLNWLRFESRCHGHGEPFSATHGQLWAGIFGAGLLHAIRRSDDEISNLCIAWWRFEYAVYKICESNRSEALRREVEPNILTEPWLPGGRAFMEGFASGNPALGTYPTRGKVLQAIDLEDRVVGKPNQYQLGPDCLEKLPADVLLQIQKWPDEIPPMWTPFHARRYSDDSCLAWFEGPRWKHAALAAGVFRGERWISVELDMALIDRYDALGSPILSLDAPQSEIPAIEEARQQKKPRRRK